MFPTLYTLEKDEVFGWNRREGTQDQKKESENTRGKKNEEGGIYREKWEKLIKKWETKMISQWKDKWIIERGSTLLGQCSVL